MRAEGTFVVPSPSTSAGRASRAVDDVERRVVEVLDGLGVPYELWPIDPDYADTGPYCERYGVPLEHAANTIIVASKKEPRQYAACVVKATTRLDVNHAVRRLMGASKLSFASAEETRAVTGMLIGGVTGFALPPGMPVYVDDKLMAMEWIILRRGRRSAEIRTPPAVLARLPHGAVVPGLAADARR